VIDSFQGRLAVQQRLLPIYRAPFFETLANACPSGLSVFAGDVSSKESIPVTQQLANAKVYPAHNHHLGEIHSPFYLLWQGGLLDWLSAWDPAVLIIEANPRYVSTRPGVSWMHHRNRPVIGWGLGAAGNPIQRAVRGWLDRFQERMRHNFLLSVDAINAYSQRGALEYQQQGVARERIFVAPNAVVSRPTQPPPQRAATFQGRAKLLFVGRLQARKRIDNLFAACSALAEPIQPEITIVGDGPVRAELEAQAKTVYPRAHFTGALRRVSRNPVSGRMAACEP
jgi:glycosyltransferase involved in cell wall biosynthesis